MPVIQIGGIVLMGDIPWTPLPFELAAVPVHDTYRVGAPKADQEIAVRCDGEGVLVGPFRTTFKVADNIFLWVQVIPRTPRVDYLAFRCYFLD